MSKAAGPDEHGSTSTPANSGIKQVATGVMQV